MNSQARPQDLLLAYDSGFIGYTSLSEMALPLEQAGDLAVPLTTGVLGGTADPDGYHDDLTAHLDRFVRAHPRLGVRGGASAPAPDWRALVVSLGGSDGYSDGGYDSDDNGGGGDGYASGGYDSGGGLGGSGGYSESGYSDGGYDSYGGYDSGDSDGHVSGDSDDHGDGYDDRGGYDGRYGGHDSGDSRHSSSACLGGSSCGCGGRKESAAAGRGAPPLGDLNEFVTALGSGDASGEMDESAAEARSYSKVGIPEGPSTVEGSILDYLASK